MALTYNNTLLLIIVTVVAEESQDRFNFVRVLVDIAENNLTLWQKRQDGEILRI